VSLPRSERVVVNVGCGPPNGSDLPDYFDGWDKLRVDVDPAVQPDIIADLTDLSAIADKTADAIWASHCIEHLYEYQVPVALAEFRRVLRDDGFVCIIVPDLQTVANYVVADRLHETLYDSPAGPVTPHDILYGFGAAIANGRPSMAHRCGFTPTMLQRAFGRLPFGEILLRRRTAQLELVAVARVTVASGNEDRQALINALGL
jgi:SAM-dependent methyltransferase